MQFESAGISLELMPLDLVEVQGTAMEVIIDKLNRAKQQAPGPVIVEDTCLSFNAFNGLPGPYM